MGPAGVGVFKQWEDPRLTTTAVLLALYLGYLLIRRLTEDPYRRATRAAVVGIVAAVDIPIVHFSVEWWRGLHQGGDHRLARQGPQPVGADAVRDRAGRHGGGLHRRLGLAAIRRYQLAGSSGRSRSTGAWAISAARRAALARRSSGEPVTGTGVEGA